MHLRPTIIRGGVIVTENILLTDSELVILDGHIVDIRPSGQVFNGQEHQREAYDKELQRVLDSARSILDGSYKESCEATIVDAQGAYILPGLIDIHSDYIETIASPRPSVVMGLEDALYKAERELVSHGITSIYHSLSIYQTLFFDHKPIRNFENVSALIDHIAAFRLQEEKGHLIRHRLHMRVELDSIDRFKGVKEKVEEGKVDLLSFMDHTPGQGQYSNLKVYGDMLKGYRSIDDEAVAEAISERQASEKLSVVQMIELADLAKQKGLALASHDDDSAEKLDYMESLRTNISEFPISLAVAKDARGRGMHTLAGAPNVLMGFSHSGNLSAREAVLKEAVDILCSDYYPAALLHSVFLLHREYGVDLARACALATINPARAAGIDGELGSLAVGKRADILVVRELEGGLPVVCSAYVGGRRVYLSEYPCFNRGEVSAKQKDDVERRTASEENAVLIEKV